MPSSPSVLAVCVNFNGRRVLPRLLESLGRSQGVDLKTLVVDNASEDGSWQNLPDWAEALRLEENRGYAAALNAGLQASGELGGDSGVDFFLLLNNDLEFGARMIARLARCAERGKAGVCGPKVLQWKRPDHLEAAWGKVTFSHVLARFRGKGRADGPRFRQPRQAEVLLGCCLLVRPRVFRQVGLFDERFFMYHEEVDFLYRCRRAGVGALFCPQARVLHRGAHSSRRTPLRKIYWVRRNTVLFLRKHAVGPSRWARFWASLTASLAWNALTLRWRRAGVILRGVADGLRQPGAPAGEGR